jgi:hypothetical protein
LLEWWDPTLSEGIKLAAQTLGTDVAKFSCSAT